MDLMLQLSQFMQNLDFTHTLFFWGCVIVFFAIFEIMVPGLVSVWFVFGGILALITALCGVSAQIQLIVFVVGSALTLIFCRPLMKVVLRVKSVPTNAEAFIGKRGVVIETINNVRSTGYVKLDGIEFRARTARDGEEVESDSTVQVERIEGNTLFVTKV